MGVDDRGRLVLSTIAESSGERLGKLWLKGMVEKITPVVPMTRRFCPSGVGGLKPYLPF